MAPSGTFFLSFRCSLQTHIQATASYYSSHNSRNCRKQHMTIDCLRLLPKYFMFSANRSRADACGKGLRWPCSARFRAGHATHCVGGGAEGLTQQPGKGWLPPCAHSHVSTFQPTVALHCMPFAGPDGLAFPEGWWQEMKTCHQS